MDNSVVAIAISGSKKSKYIIRWALENLVRQGHISIKLLHVFPEIKTVPTPMGNGIPITQVREDIAAAFRKEVEYQTTEKILPYKMLCIKKQVPTDVVQIESDNVADAISEEIAKRNINKLVIGTSSTGGMFSSSYWIPRGQNMSSRISEACPSFCTVYAVSKGKLLSVRPSYPEARSKNQEETTVDDVRVSNHSPSYTINLQPSDDSDHWSAQSSPIKHPQFSPISPTKKYQPSPSNTSESSRTNPNDNRSFFGEGNDAILSNYGSSDFSDQKSNLSGTSRSFTTEIHSWPSTDQSSSLNASSDFSSGGQVNINFELEQLRMELKHVQKMYAKAQTDALDASRKLNDLHQQRFEETIKLKEISLREKEAKELAEQEKAKHEAAKREADIVKQCAEKEAELKIAAERNAVRDAKARHKFEDTLSVPSQHFQEFSWEEITLATSSFSDDLKVGMGSYGTVYKCTLRHTTAAVKVLHSLAANRTKQFQQEIEILSKIRHPNLLTLLGACPERGCLVYEYMENGSLEERLLHRKPPIPWYERFRIAREVASALIFLHNSKPKPIIHRDLKPANILLDHNLASKIGDVGLSTMLHSDTTAMMYKDTSPVGTLCYIDPEYQRTGLVSPKSDVYAFGIVMLQLLTAKPAMGLARKMETALEDGRLERVLDPEAGDWPVEEAKEMAVLALKCAELRHGDRPDLESEVLPALDKLKMVADNARDSALSGPTGPPGHFICPLLKDVMNDPCVAADGYSYDRKAIEEWLEENDASPVTSLPLVHKRLIPNYTLLSAITHWKSGKR